jgi:isopentenyl-diphosphate delta-isomerase
MANTEQNFDENSDLNASERKKDHIELALKSRILSHQIDTRFDYEPLMSPHPVNHDAIGCNFLGKRFNVPIWVSSMTGGTALAGIINKNLAKACGEFRMGMGLGSCRQLLYSDEYLADFQVKKYMGEQPLYANLGIAQLESLIESGEVLKITELLYKLEADGLIIHINPLQEWLQPEGDRFKHSPIDTLKRLLDIAQFNIIVKEVGQGMGPKSLCALLQLPIEAIDFGASGGTNFAMLEMLRSAGDIAENYNKLAHIGHSAEEMVQLVNTLQSTLGNRMLCRQIIISGGINDFLDGYYLMQKLSIQSVYGQASGLLAHAQESYERLHRHIDMQVQGLALAKAYLSVK